MRAKARRTSVRAVLWAVFLVLLAVSAHADECKSGSYAQSLTGTLLFHEEDFGDVGTPFTLKAGETYYALYPEGSFFGMPEGAPGYEANADAKLGPHLGRQVTVTGCSSVDSTGFHAIEGVSSVQAA